MDADLPLQEAIDRTTVAAAAVVAGDPGEFNSLWATDHAVTLFGAFGDGVHGRDEVAQRVAWASARFAGGELVYEPMTSASSSDIGYAVGIERGRVRMDGDDTLHEMVLRVTHVFRREGGEWRLAHRHADPVASVTPPTAVLAHAAPAGTSADGRP